MVDLGKNALQVDIPEVLSEGKEVKFTVRTKTNLPEYSKQEFSVVRQHEEFIDLHKQLKENKDNANYIASIPPPPPRPDFDALVEKLRKLGEEKSAVTDEKFEEMKNELEKEYLAVFKKTVAMHEVFLSEFARHPVFSKDNNFKAFLE